MALSLDQIKKLVETPAAKAQISKAISHENRLKFHSEKVLERLEASPYLNDFDQWIEALLPKDKAAAFKLLMQFPLYSNSLVDAITDELAKVFDSENSSFTYEFTSDADKEDFRYYLENDKFNFMKWWRDTSLSEMVTNISSLVVIDIPKGESERAEPYAYFMNMSQVIDLGIGKDGSINYLIAHGDGDTLYVFDELSYRVYEFTNKVIGQELTNATHELGYCPVCFFWKTDLNKKWKAVKESPVTGSLTNLNWLVYFETARRAAEMYASYPIDITYKEKCNYSESKEGVTYHCEGGKVNRGQFGTVNCPACESRKMVGPGTHLKVPFPASKEQGAHIEAMKRISADVPSMEWLETRRDSIWDEIYFDCVGWGGEEMDKQAVNEKQVKSNFESKQNVLLRLKENLEASHTFTISTMARLRYSSFSSATINYGTKWYLQSETEATEEFKNVKTSGAPVYMIAQKRETVDKICTKGNDLYASRLNILKQLEPWPDLSLAECKANGLDLANFQEFVLKSGLSGFIMRFERENGSIVDFGRKIDYNTKITRIKAKLLEYAKEIAPKEPADPALEAKF